ncbi:hypothetical protein BJY04DRAFT_216260 [Aspergillus karnatakaensis]|uniref:uncharacterized protein n=1 Tax=Aspergillus karnatakaensis TaxID=1810916 RepID=UPI003CCD70AD
MISSSGSENGGVVGDFANTDSDQLSEDESDILQVYSDGTADGPFCALCPSEQLSIGQLSTPSTAEDLSEDLLPFLVVVGDNAGCVWKSLRAAADDPDIDLPDRVGDLCHNLDIETGDVGPGLWIDDIEKCLAYFREEGLEVDFDMARLAIQLYTDRNKSCHSAVGKLGIAHDLQALSSQITEDIAKLSGLLPKRFEEDRENFPNCRQLKKPALPRGKKSRIKVASEIAVGFAKEKVPGLSNSRETNRRQIIALQALTRRVFVPSLMAFEKT